MIPVSPVRRENAALKVEIEDAIRDVVSSGELILGPNVTGFEGSWARSVGASHAVGVASGLDALEAALRAVGVRAGDRVVVPALSAAATALAPLRIGAEPVFADVNRTTGLIDIERLICDSSVQSPAAIVHVALYGLHPTTIELEALSQSMSAPVVQDMAQAHAATAGEVREGSPAAVAAWSFYPTKNLGALGDAGAITTDDPQIADWVRRWRNYGQAGRYEHIQEGVNARLDEIQAAVLEVKLPHLEEWTDVRRTHALHFLANIDVARLPCLVKSEQLDRHVLHQFVVVPENRNDFRQFMADRGIATDAHYPTALPDQPALSRRSQCRVDEARFLADRVVSIPVHPFLSDKEVDLIGVALRDWCSR
jgi:dTDP-3-amino-3,4,6-trideoxy-alpha-D-glucose transaminase